MERASRETWTKRIERWKDSGLTAKEFAAEIGINAHSLSWWRWRLESVPSATPRTRRRARKANKAPAISAEPMTFVELPSPVAAEPFEVVLPSSLRVRVPAGFDAATLRRLLDVLGARA
jgi:transposase